MTTSPSPAEASGTDGIDPRSPRFGAAITAALTLTTVGLGLTSAAAPASALLDRVAEPAFVLLAVITALFAWGAFAGIRRHPYGAVFRAVVRPRLAAPTHREDAAPPTFAQGVGLIVALAGIALHVLGVPYGLVAAAAAAFIASFLNAAFDYCLGCQIYLGLSRLRTR